MTIILGIDPGSINTGYGIIRKLGSKLEYITSGVISVKGSDVNSRLPIIFTQLQEVIATYQPEQLVIEQVFLADNPQTALKLGMARGVAILACSLAGMNIFELSARQAKKFVTGMGNAKKEMVNRMVCRILGLTTAPKIDASDALALAISHANTLNARVMIQKQQQQMDLFDKRTQKRLASNTQNREQLQQQLDDFDNCNFDQSKEVAPIFSKSVTITPALVNSATVANSTSNSALANATTVNSALANAITVDSTLTHTTIVNSTAANFTSSFNSVSVLNQNYRSTVATAVLTKSQLQANLKKFTSELSSDTLANSVAKSKLGFSKTNLVSRKDIPSTSIQVSTLQRTSSKNKVQGKNLQEVKQQFQIKEAVPETNFVQNLIDSLATDLQQVQTKSSNISPSVNSSIVNKETKISRKLKTSTEVLTSAAELKETNLTNLSQSNVPDATSLMNFKINKGRYAVKTGKGSNRSKLESKIKQILKKDKAVV